MSAQTELENRYTIIGTRPPRYDAAAKATGRALYGPDMSFPGLLHGKVLRSPHAHARILSVDAGRAEALPGVYAVVTAEDLSEAEYRYDAESKTYKRFDVGEPSMDELTGDQVAPANVLVLYANHVDTDILADAHDPNNLWYAVSIQLWGQGPAKLLRDGQVQRSTV